ncbi:MAG: amidophosphoribosyltransferase, partial [Planctomycetota bacterium]
MCGFIGIFGPDGTDVAPEIYEGLLAVQHRGQDAAGITTFTDRFHIRKAFGLVVEVFDEEHMARLGGNLGLGHVRYPTVGANRDEDAQPFHHTFPLGTAMVHNGNVTNYVELSDTRFKSKMTRLNSTCDVEVLLYVFQQGLAQRFEENGGRLAPDDVFFAVEKVYADVKGAYSVCAMIADVGMVTFRDPYGIKPAVFGERRDERGVSYASASESVVLDVNGYTRTIDLGPGEAVFVDMDRRVHRQQVTNEPHRPCIFEYVYFARPDSFLDDISVYKTRHRFGEALARQWKESGAPIPDAVIPVPDSSRDAALACAMELGVPYREGLVKNRYIGRTFIMPNQNSRTSSIRRKLNPIGLEFENKDVLLVDDSIVRGNTSRKIVQMVREAGAKEIHFRSASPPITHQDFYGIDMADRTELIAANQTLEQMRDYLKVESLGFLSVPGLYRAIGVE